MPPAPGSSTGARRPRRLRQGAAKARAVVDGSLIVAGATGRLPWARPRPLPAIEYPKVFVVGCARSGTTWVAQLLRQHPRVIGGRESHLYPVVHGALDGRDPRRIEPWARLVHGFDRGVMLGRENVQHYVDRRAFVALARDALARGGDAGRVATALIRGILDSYYERNGGTGDQVLVEKTPGHIAWVERIFEDFPEAHVVEVVRDGRDVCVSMEMRALGDPVFRMARRTQITMWSDAIRAGMAMRANPAWAGRWSLVRYEDLKQDPVGELDRLFEETGIGRSPGVAADAVAAFDLASLPTGEGAHIFRGDAGSWRDRFTDDDRSLFREMAGDLFVAAGYRFDD